MARNKKIRKEHIEWLINAERAILLNHCFEGFELNSKRIDILFNLNLLEDGTIQDRSIYVLSELGKSELKKYRAKSVS